MPQCNVSGYKNHSSCNKKAGITFHRFPRNEARKSDWLVRIGREDFKPSVVSRVCSVHFSEDSFDRTGERVNLKRNAATNFSEGSTQRVIDWFNL